MSRNRAAFFESNLALSHPQALLLAVLFAVLTGLAAHLKIPLPFTPVPLTLQTYVVLLCGPVLGTGYGLVSQALYILLGGLGLPWFAFGGGWSYLLGPTSGYLAAYVVVTPLLARVLGRPRSLPVTFGWMLVAGTIILVLGTAWLAFAAGLGLAGAIAQGLLPFLPGDVLKAAASALTLLAVRRPHERTQ